MGLFDKKNCDICGGKIGLLGNRKLEDGNMCKDCAAKLSPFTTDRRKTTLAEIKDHLAYREANKAEVAKFNVTRTFGDRTKVLIDEDAKKFIVTSSGRWQSENPDVMAFSQVTGCQTEIEEIRTELKTKDKDGKSISYNPPRYDIDYNFNLTIHVNSPFFNEINFQLNKNNVRERHSVEFKEFERQANEIESALTQVRQDAHAARAFA
jgi:aminopeptidase-like protein